MAALTDRIHAAIGALPVGCGHHDGVNRAYAETAVTVLAEVLGELEQQLRDHAKDNDTGFAFERLGAYGLASQAHGYVQGVERAAGEVAVLRRRLAAAQPAEVTG